LSQNWSKTFFDDEKTFIGIWNNPNNRPNIQSYALRTFTFSLQTFAIFFLINVFINVYYNFLTFITFMTSNALQTRLFADLRQIKDLPDVKLCGTTNKKFELMLTRRDKAYSRSGSVV